MNKHRENIFQYLNDEDTLKFVKLIDNQLKNGIQSELQHTDIILPVSEPNSNNGVFNSDNVHNVIYMFYILNKYNASVPMQYPVDDKKVWDIYKMNIAHFTLGTNSDSMISSLLFYHNNCFGLVPHIILWRNKYYHYISKDIDFFIKRELQNSSEFIIIKLVISPGESLHSNAVIYDKKNNILTRFEPYGDWDMADSYHLDLKIIDIFKSCLDKSLVHKLKYIRPTEYLNKTKFQSVSLGDDQKHKNLGDPAGYCLAWTYWFLELKILNRNINDNVLVKMAYNKIFKDADNKSSNPLLHYIRGYAKHLDNEKNMFLEKIGIHSQEHYKLNYSSNFISILNKYIDDYVKEKIMK